MVQRNLPGGRGELHASPIGFYDEYDHARWHERAARKHDVEHHRLYDEHAPNRARWYYGDDRDW